MLAVLAGALAVSAKGQSITDAYRFGGLDYTGTARTMGLGGAMGAVGCDLGSVTINPAGGAVAGYSQFTITPNLGIATAASSYALSPTEAYGPAQKSRRTAFTLPNAGVSMRFDSDGSGALTSFSFGFIINSTYAYNSVSKAGAINNVTSKFAEMANAASGIAHNYLGTSAFYSDEAYSGYWDAAMGYDVGLINSFGAGSEYVGCTEVLTDLGSHYVPGNLIQNSSVISGGSKNDLLMNMAFNFRDKVYFGINMGLPLVSYSNVEKFTEVAQVREDFPVSLKYKDGTVQSTYFDNAVYQYNYDASGAGIYLKAGVIWLPFSFLRLGAAYQTPTAFDITETWVHSGSVAYADGSRYSGSGEVGNYEYSYTAPQSVDLSLALTLGRIGLLSVDYTLMDYKHIKYADYYDGNTDWYDMTNTAMRAFSGVSHNLRAGIEVNVLPSFCLRAGYSLLTCPEKYYELEGGAQLTYGDYDEDYYYGRKQLPSESYYYDELTQSFSAGIGYNPAGSFFADLAVRYTKYPDSIFQPYYDYGGFLSPRIANSRGLWNAALTLGWRF